VSHAAGARAQGLRDGRRRSASHAPQEGEQHLGHDPSPVAGLYKLGAALPALSNSTPRAGSSPCHGAHGAPDVAAPASAAAAAQARRRRLLSVGAVAAAAVFAVALLAAVLGPSRALSAAAAGGGGGLGQGGVWSEHGGAAPLSLAAAQPPPATTFVPCEGLSELECGLVNKEPLPREDFRGLPRRVEAGGGVVAADNSRCSQVGAKVLEEGGHAVDAAVATALCLGVVNPISSGLVRLASEALGVGAGRPASVAGSGESGSARPPGRPIAG
jgi:hypothetical protein